MPDGGEGRQRGGEEGTSRSHEQDYGGRLPVKQAETHQSCLKWEGLILPSLCGQDSYILAGAWLTFWDPRTKKLGAQERGAEDKSPVS